MNISVKRTGGIHCVPTPGFVQNNNSLFGNNNLFHLKTTWSTIKAQTGSTSSLPLSYLGASWPTEKASPTVRFPPQHTLSPSPLRCALLPVERTLDQSTSPGTIARNSAGESGLRVEPQGRGGDRALVPGEKFGARVSVSEYFGAAAKRSPWVTLRRSSVTVAAGGGKVLMPSPLPPTYPVSQ